MGLNRDNASGGGDFELAPKGTHPARCYRVIDLGTQYNAVFDKSQPKLLVSWEMPTKLMTDGRPFSVHSRYTFSFHEKSNLMRDLTSWLGDEAETVEIHTLIGRECLINVAHNEGQGGKVYANVSGVMELPEEMTCPAAVNPTVLFDLNAPDPKVMEELSERLRDQIKASDEWKEIEAKRLDDPTRGSDETPF